MGAVSAWAGKRVLFTGAQGFIGSWVAERLLEEGAEILVLDRPPAEPSRFRTARVARALHGGGRRSSRPPLAVQRDRGSRGAGRVPSRSERDRGIGGEPPLETFEVNVRGTWNLLEACRVASEPPARIVVASTDKAYGIHEQLPYREDHALQPHYPYDASKAGADIIARSYAHTFGLPVAVTRFGNVFGGGDFNFSRLIPGTIRALLAGERPVIRSDGLMERDFLYAEDAVAAYLAIARSLDRPELRGRAWNASIGRPVSVLEIVTRLIEISGLGLEPDVLGRGTPHGELERQWLDCSAIAAELGWTPEWDLQRGLRATFGWYASELPLSSR